MQLSRQVTAADLGGLRNLLDRPYIDWDDALEHLAAAASESRLLLVLDEYPELERTSPDLPAIANGRTRHNQIKGWVRAEPTRTLDRLIELRLVDRVVPVTDDPDRTHRRLYRIADDFLAFHLGLVSRYRAEIDRGLGDSILPVLIASLDDHLGDPWEHAVTDHIRAACNRGELAPDVVAVGPWWREDGEDEINTLALAGRSWTPVLAGETKWARAVQAAPPLGRLQRKAAAVAPDGTNISYVLSARDEVRNPPPGLVILTAAEVFPDAPT